MATEICIPQLGLTMTEATVLHWLKGEGDPVQKGEPVLEIETDKVVAEVEAPADGVLGPILAVEGMAAPVGQVIGYILAPGEEAPAETRAAVPAAPIPAKLGPPSSILEAPPTRHASPKARRLAKELGVDLASMQGTGPRGRVIAADVQRAAECAEAHAASAPTATVPPGDVEPLRGIRRIVAERMTHSFTTTPHFYLTTEVEATALVRMREGLLSKVEAATGARLTITDILVKVVAQSLQEFADVNVAWADDSQGGVGGVLRQSEVNIGVAVAVSDGLIVPVIHDADKLSLGDIARRRADIMQRAQSGKLTLVDLEGGTFTLSNLGMFGVDQFQAVINSPQSAILAVGQIKERPLVVAGNLAIRHTMFLTLSVDHRLLDGVQAARFLQRAVQLIEEPLGLITR